MKRALMLSLMGMTLTGFALFGSRDASAGGRNYTIEADLGPSTSTNTVTISAAGSAKRNCLTNVVVISTDAYTFRILDGGTTDYSVVMPAGSGVVQDWSIDDPFCGTVNTQMEIKCSAVVYSINYKGFVGR